MRHARHIVMLVPLVAASTCKKSEPPPEASPHVEVAPPDRRARCEQLARDVAAGASVGAKLFLLARADADAGERGALLEPAVDEGIAGTRGDLVEQCTTWPEELLACLSSPLAAMDDDCQSSIAEATGQAVAPTDVSVGPGVAWRHTLPGKARGIWGAPAGQVVALVETSNDAVDADGGLELLALDAGTVVWRHRLPESARMVALSDGSMLRTRGGELSAMDLASGKTRWTTTLPSDPDGDASLRVRAVALAPAGWIVVDSAARVFTVRPSSCAEHRSSCYEPMGRLPDDEPLDEVEMLVHAELLWVREHATLRALTTDGLETRFVARAHERVGWVADHPGGIVTIIDDEVMVLDPASCRGAEVVAPSTWPRPGRPVAPELDACPDCAAPPPGCVAWRAHVRDIDPSPPVVLDDGTIVVHDDRGFTLGLRDGETRWKSATAGSGPTLRHDGALLVLGTGFAEGDHLVIWGLSGDDGRHQFETPLPFAVDGVVHALDDFAFARTDDLVVAAYRTELVAVDLTQRD